MIDITYYKSAVLIILFGLMCVKLAYPNLLGKKGYVVVVVMCVKFVFSVS